MPDDRSQQEIADRLGIDDLLTRYAWAIDDKDWDALATVFTEDARIDYTSAGGISGTRDDVVAWLAETLSAFPMTQHMVTTRQVTLDGDRATARSMLFNPMGLSDGEGGLRVFYTGGVYRDRLRRTSDGWRIEERTEEALWFDGDLPEGVR